MLLLHISDIHFRSPDCLNPDQDPDRPYRTRLIQDVGKKVIELGPVNAILIGGDIAFKGAADEYTVAMTWIKELAAQAGCPMERVFCIPGNHDVDRAAIAKSITTQNAQAAIARAHDRRERTLRAHINDPDAGRALLAPLAAYNEFAKVLNCQVYLPERLYWKQDLNLTEDVVLRVHGLTSTLLSGANDTRESLYLSPLQTVLDPVEDVVNLVLCHHPPDWFMDQDDVDDAVCGRARVQMFGHKHRQRIRRDDQYIRYSAGAVNPDRGELGWQPGYNLVHINVAGEGAGRRLEVRSHLRQWQTNSDMFTAVRTPTDADIFEHTIPFPGAARADKLKTSPSTGDSFMPQATEPAGVKSAADPEPATDGEAAMGNASTRNLVFRFWNLKASQRRDVMLGMGLIVEADMAVDEPQRYGRALIRASDENRLEELAAEITKLEGSNG